MDTSQEQTLPKPDDEKTNNPPPVLEQKSRAAANDSDIQSRLNNAQKLKNYATFKGLNVSNDTLEKLNQAAFSWKEKGLSKNESVQLDSAIRDLVKVTYPTTVETLEYAENMDFYKIWPFRLFVIALAVAAIFIAVWSSNQLSTSYNASYLAMSLGLLGSLLFYLFNIIGLIEEKAINASDGYNNFVRIFLGPVVGWIFYFGFCQKAFEVFYVANAAISAASAPGGGGGSPPPPGAAATPLLLLLPFLAGFSTKLVVGILNQLIRAAQLTLGIEDKKTDLALRNRKSKDIPT